jgi:hypothetical protein
MTRVELKKKLKNRIDAIENDLLLEEMLRLAGLNDCENDIYHLSDEQLNAVEEAEQQFGRGEFISGEEADKMIREWLEK